jgi:pyruvate dehydrogenase E2 component (dihydrolipoyllysine-residue acetyltransferase)
MADKGTIEVVELTRAGQAAARRAAEARATVPAFSVGAPAVAVSGPPGRLLAAVAAALRAHPAVNGAYRDGRLERYGRVNIGVLVDAPDVPLAPVLADADTRDADALEADLERLTARAQAGELTAAEQSGATFLVSLVDTGRVEPVVGGGHAAVLGAGTTELTLACDARALTPFEAAAFLRTVVGGLA